MSIYKNKIKFQVTFEVDVKKLSGSKQAEFIGLDDDEISELVGYEVFENLECLLLDTLYNLEVESDEYCDLEAHIECVEY
jgi:hypothetical protein